MCVGIYIVRLVMWVMYLYIKHITSRCVNSVNSLNSAIHCACGFQGNYSPYGNPHIYYTTTREKRGGGKLIPILRTLLVHLQ